MFLWWIIKGQVLSFPALASGFIEDSYLSLQQIIDYEKILIFFNINLLRWQ